MGSLLRTSNPYVDIVNGAEPPPDREAGSGRRYWVLVCGNEHCRNIAVYGFAEKAGKPCPFCLWRFRRRAVFLADAYVEWLRNNYRPLWRGLRPFKEK